MNLRQKIHYGTDLSELLPLVDETFSHIPRQLKLQIDELSRRLPQSGLRLARRPGDGTDPFGLRPFEEGRDPSNRISARHSARFGEDQQVVIDRELEIKQFHYQWRDPMMGADPRMGGDLHAGFRSRNDLLTDKQAAEISMLIWAKKLSAHGDAASIIAGDTVHRFGRNAGQIAGRLSEVAIMAESLPNSRKMRYGSRATLWGKFYDDERTAQMLESLSARGIRGYLIRVQDPCEIDFNFPDNTELAGLHGETSPDGQTRKIFSDAASMRQKWKDVLFQNSKDLENLCHAHGFKLLIQRTDEPLQNSMLRMLRNESEDLEARIINGESLHI